MKSSWDMDMDMDMVTAMGMGMAIMVFQLKSLAALLVTVQVIVVAMLHHMAAIHMEVAWAQVWQFPNVYDFIWVVIVFKPFFECFLAVIGAIVSAATSGNRGKHGGGGGHGHGPTKTIIIKSSKLFLFSLLWTKFNFKERVHCNISIICSNSRDITLLPWMNK